MMPDRLSRKATATSSATAVLGLAIALGLSFASCIRPPATSPTATPPAARLADSSSTAALATLSDGPPVAMKSAAKTKPESAAKAAAATSLAGFDRHLVARPFDASTAADFELGPLAPGSIDMGLSTTLSALAAGLVAASLPYDRFDAKAAMVARLLLAEPLASAPAIVSVRYSAPLIGPEGTASVGIRVFGLTDADRQDGGKDQSSRRAARGLVILGRDEHGVWSVEHLEIDLAALALSATRTVPWDPYATPSPY